MGMTQSFMQSICILLRSLSDPTHGRSPDIHTPESSYMPARHSLTGGPQEGRYVASMIYACQLAAKMGAEYT